MPTLELIRPITGKNGVTLPPGTIRNFPEAIARVLIERGAGRPVSQDVPSCPDGEVERLYRTIRPPNRAKNGHSGAGRPCLLEISRLRTAGSSSSRNEGDNLRPATFLDGRNSGTLPGLAGFP